MSVKYSIILSGGAGRIITAIPALEEFAKSIQEQGEEVRIFSYGWTELFLSNPILQNIAFDINQKGNFVWIRDSHIISPEPYFNNRYMNQQTNLVGAFWYELMGEFYPHTEDGDEFDIESYLSPTIYLTKVENNFAKQALDMLKQKTNKNKVIIFQPFGSGAKLEGNEVIDSSNRSMNINTVTQIVNDLSSSCAVVYFGPDELYPQGSAMASTNGLVPNRDLRFWASLIANSDGFIGVDSVGQHMAKVFDKNTVLVLGATLRENISYKGDSIVEFRSREPEYVPIRVNQVDADLADRMNEGIMDFNQDEIESLKELIRNHFGFGTTSYPFVSTPSNMNEEVLDTFGNSETVYKNESPTNLSEFLKRKKQEIKNVD